MEMVIMLFYALLYNCAFREEGRKNTSVILLAQHLNHIDQFSPVTQSCPALCDPMGCSTPGLPIHHHLPEFTQTHVHQVGDVIQLSHPLLTLLLLPSIFPSIRVFSSESVLGIRWTKYWSFSFSISPSSEYSGLISFRIDWFIALLSKRLSRVFSSTTV